MSLHDALAGRAPLAEQETFWTATLAGELPIVTLPGDHPRPPYPTFRRAEASARFDADLSAALRAFCARTRLPLFTVLLAAFDALLARYTGQEDIIAGSLAADGASPGRVVNPIALRATVPGDISGAALLRRVDEAIAAAAAHRDYRFADLVRALDADRHPHRAPIFQIMLVVCDEAAGLSASAITRDDLDEIADITARCDLVARVSAEGGALVIACEFDSDLAEPSTITRFLEHFRMLLAGMIARPERRLSSVPLLTPFEREQMLVAWNPPGDDLGLDMCLHEGVAAQAARTPDAVALAFESDQLTYQALDRRANQLARAIRALGAGPEDPVGICIERSLELVIGLLGVLKAGGVYLPLDPAYPSERLAFMLADSGARILLTLSNDEGRKAKDEVHPFAFRPSLVNLSIVDLAVDWPAIARECADPPAVSVTAANLAYVLYTSGSTGQPKGVACSHRGVINLLADCDRRQPLGAGDGCSFWTSSSFDVSLYEAFSALLAGGALHIAPERVRSDGASFLEWLARRRIASAYIPPFMLAELAARVQQPAAPTDLIRLLVGVEPIHEPVLATICAHIPALRIINGYGPTEASICATLYDVDPHAAEDRTTPIGRPVRNAQVYLLDRQLQPTPIGLAGELYICGSGLARGYHNRPDLTAERFVPNPFAEGPGVRGQGSGVRGLGADPEPRTLNPKPRLYRTGDLARYRADGVIEFLGRIDQQVKLRGFRVEPDEVAALLRQHPAVSAAVAMVREDRPGDRRLAAYVVTSNEFGGTSSPGPTKDQGRRTQDEGADSSLVPRPSSLAADLRKWLAARLPDYMLPSAIVALDALPLLPSGKLDRSALPAPMAEETLAAERFVPPRSPIEALLAEIWSDVLGVQRVGAYDDFFEAGGHSLLAMQVIARVRAMLGVELSQRSLFEAPTLARLAAQVDLALRARAPTPAPAIMPRGHADPVPLSFAQQRLWFLDQLEPNSPLYNIPSPLRLSGPLDVVAFAKSLGEIVRRHEVLRTVFSVHDREPVQLIMPATPLALPVIDLRGLPDRCGDAALRGLAREQGAMPFDLARGPLLRVALLRMAEQTHVLLLTMHHIVADGWSMGVFHHELAALYQAFSAGRPSPLPDLPIQYADFALWQRRQLHDSELDPLLAYWRDRLGSDLPVVEIPPDYPRPATQIYSGARIYEQLPGALVDSLRQLCRREGVTLFMALLAAFQVVLYRYADQEDIVVGADIAGRNIREVEGLIGFFVNQLVLRTDLSGAPPFKELLGRVREAALGAYAHQDLPFDKLVEVLKPVRELNRAPLFQIKLVLQNTAQAPEYLGPLRIEALDFASETARFDVLLALTETRHGLAGILEYSTALFAPATIHRMWGHFQSVLEAAARDPGRRIPDLPLLTQPERAELLALCAGPLIARAPRGLHELFEAAIARTPDALAVASRDAALSYAALNRRADQLASYLQTIGVGPDVLVALCMERSPELIVSMLALLKAGGAYMPLDPTYPPDRLAFMLQDAQPRALLIQDRLLGVVPPTRARVVRFEQAWRAAGRRAGGLRRADPAQLAYVIYTSGSTGQPKGALVAHGGAADLVEGVIAAYGVQLDDRVVQFFSPNFDVSILDGFMALGAGAALCLPPPEVMASGDALHNFIAEQAITIARLPPSIQAQLPAGALPSLRAIIIGGEAWPASLRDRWTAGQRFCNEYGATEGGLCATMHDCSADDPRPAIGKPIANVRIYLLDAHLQLVPIGVAGELCVGGAGLARGYLNRPELTAERFIPNPFGTLNDEDRTMSEPNSSFIVHRSAFGARLYKTGDLARYRADGVIEFLGRIDNQVKLRGYRIELDEIAAVARRCPAVRDCVVVQREDAPGDRRLAAYIVQESGVRGQGSGGPAPNALIPEPRAPIPELRSFLAAQLPAYMIPSAFVRLDALPLLPNGKVDRRALPPPERAEALPGADDGALPRTMIERTLAAIWAEVLGQDDIGIHENFFDVGGHSLLATQLLSRVRDRLQAEASVRAFFEDPTIAGLAAQVEQLLRQEPAAQTGAIRPISRMGDLPLSFAQQRLWFINRLKPESPAYNIPAAIRLSGALDLAALARALRAIIRRHETLRTSFATVGGQPVQVITAAALAQLDLRVIDIGGLVRDAREPAADRLVSWESRQTFDLARGPLLRVRILRLGKRAHLLLLTMHHVVSDGWSVDIFMRELSALYNAFASDQPDPLPDLPIQYVDFAAWQRQWLESADMQAQLSYWQRQLAGLPQMLDLPTDRRRPSVQSYTGRHLSFALPPALAASLSALSKGEDATLFMTLLAAFQVLLHRYSGQDDLATGTPVANRSRSEIEPLIGFFVNTLVIRADLAGNPRFRDALGRARTVMLDAYAHQDLPFEKLVEVLQPQRSLSHTPLFQVVFILQQTPATHYLNLAGMETRLLLFETGTAKFDLTFLMWEERNTLVGTIEYSADLFERATIERMIGHWRALLEGAAADPTRRILDLPLLTEAEQEQVLTQWGAGAPDYPADRPVARLFEAQAAATPDAIAVVYDGAELTYAGLNARANQLAHHLQALGVGPDALVGIGADRSLEMVVGILGILKAGGAYVPLDPDYPPERIRFMLGDAGVQALLTQTARDDRRWSIADGAQANAGIVYLDADWPAISARPTSAPPLGVLGAQRAYVIYTSGSTGQPKGVMALQRGLLNLVYGLRGFFTDPQVQAIGLITSISFDISVNQIFPCLLFGRALHVIPDAVKYRSPALSAYLDQRRINLLDAVPSYLNLALTELQGSAIRHSLSYLLIGGERLEQTLIERIFAQFGPHVGVVNIYGLTETTDINALARMAARDLGEVITIGRPLQNTQLYILNQRYQAQPVGVIGEVCIAGDGMARGYLNRPDLTAERFIPNPFGTMNDEDRTMNEPESAFSVHRSAFGARLYKTGDVGRWLPDGRIELLGRIDQQVKLRGFRIELGEIEAVLQQHAGVQQAAVLLREDAPGGRRLVAYVVASDEVQAAGGSDTTRDEGAASALVTGHSSLAAELRSWLAARLPAHMIPAAFVLMDALPRTPNGKVDRRALPDLEQAADAASEEFAAPVTAVERSIAAIWRSALRREEVGIHANFFDLGGHSLLIVQVQGALQEAFGIPIAIVDLFRYPTVSALAAYLGQRQAPPAEPRRGQERRDTLKERRKARQSAR